jgi:DNA (cytosine-5)-methyltransferase 1
MNAPVDRLASVLDLFAAPGGLSSGFSEAGYRIVAVLDHDPWGCKTLTNNFGSEGTVVIQGNIERLMVSGRVDVVVGSPPCQSFSVVGRPKINHLKEHSNRSRFIDDKRNRLYKHFVKVVEAVQPAFFVMENVPGMLSYRGGRIKDQVLEDFERIGYSTAMKVLNAADFGVPQVRHRAVFIGNRLGVENPFPKEHHYDPRDEHSREDVRGLSPRLTVRDAISDLPPLGAGEGEDEMDYPPPSQLTLYQRWAREGATKLYNHRARGHSERDRKLFRMLKPGKKMVDLPERLRPYRSDIFKDKIMKQRWDRPSTAILAHMQKDGLMYVHPSKRQARSFTPREAARLQSFRDRYRFMGPMTQQFGQIGNAVPPLVAQAIAAAIRPFLEPLEVPKVEYETLRTRVTKRAISATTLSSI